MTEVLAFEPREVESTMAGQDSLSLHLEMLHDEWIQARRPQEQEWLEDYQDAMAIARDGDSRGTGVAKANKASPLFIGATRSKIRTAKARIRDSLFSGGRLPFDTSPVKEEFRQHADTFELIVEHQLREDEYPMTLTAGITAEATYGTGWIMGPFVVEKSIDEIVMEEPAPGYRVMGKKEYKYKCPHFEHARTMDVWPDPDAINEQSGKGLFWVSPKPPGDLQDWKDKEQYRNVDAALREYSRYTQDSGSYLAEQARGNVERFTKDGRINLVRFFGRVPAKMLREWETGTVGASDQNTDEERNVEIVAIMAGGIVVRAYKSPYKERPARRCVYEEAVEPEMYGVGISRNNRPHQKVVNAAFRLYMEGKGFSLLGMWDVDRSKFSPRENFKMYPGKVFERNPGVTPEEAKQAMIQHKFDDVTAGWENVIALSEKFSDDDTGISKYTQGQDSSNLNKTATGVSMIMNASSVPLKDVMANIDIMWIDKHITDLIEWNLEFLEHETVEKLHGQEHAKRWAQIKQLGSAKFMTWKPTGQSTFIAKEVLANKLQSYMQLALSSEVAVQQVDMRELMEQVWDALDVGKESPVLTDEDLEKQGQPQVPPEIQEQMMLAKKEFDALLADHQKMQQENQSLQLQLHDKQEQTASTNQQAMSDLEERQRQFNAKMEFDQEKLIAELRLKKNESDKVLQEIGNGKAELEALKSEVITERRILTAEKATITAQIELAKNSGGEEAAIKKYEADKKYEAELAKAAASIIMAKMQPKEAEGEGKEEATEEGVKSDTLEKTMAMLHEAVLKMAAPKEIVFDDAGNPVGIKPVEGK